MNYSGNLQRLIGLAIAAALCTGCSGPGGSGLLTPQGAAAAQAPMVKPGAMGQASLRAIHGSPDAGAVDIYVYSKGAKRPKQPTIANAQYPQITDFLSVPAGAYTVDVVKFGSMGPAVASEDVRLKGGASYSVVVAGQVSAQTLRFVNFVEPNESSSETALVVHHASPYVQQVLNGPVAVGVYDAAQKVPPEVSTVFEFALAKGTSGPAKSGKVSGGEFFLSPLPSTLPKSVGFAAGAPGASGMFAPLIAANITGLAKGLKHKTDSEKALLGDKSSEIPSDAHLSVFAIDTKSAARLIGTLDP